MKDKVIEILRRYGDSILDDIGVASHPTLTIEEAARQIDTLYTGDESGLLTDGVRAELDSILGQRLRTYNAEKGEPEIISHIHGTDVYEKLIPPIEAIIKAQQALTRKEGQGRVEGIFGKFEEEYKVIQSFGKPSPYITFKVRRTEWQSLKQQEGL